MDFGFFFGQECVRSLVTIGELKEILRMKFPFVGIYDEERNYLFFFTFNFLSFPCYVNWATKYI